MTWRTVPEGMSTHETCVFAEVDGFKACLCYSFLDLKHEASRRDHRISLFEIRNFEAVFQPSPTLVINTHAGRVLLPDVSRGFAEAMLTRVARYLPGGPAVAVSEDELRANPTRYHLQIVRSRGHHDNEFEGQRFAGAWLSVPKEVGKPIGGTVDVEGLWLSDPAMHAAWHGPRGYGHMGMSGAELLAYRYAAV